MAASCRPPRRARSCMRQGLGGRRRPPVARGIVIMRARKRAGSEAGRVAVAASRQTAAMAMARRVRVRERMGRQLCGYACRALTRRPSESWKASRRHTRCRLTLGGIARQREGVMCAPLPSRSARHPRCVPSRAGTKAANARRRRDYGSARRRMAKLCPPAACCCLCARFGRRDRALAPARAPRDRRTRVPYPGGRGRRRAPAAHNRRLARRAQNPLDGRANPGQARQQSRQSARRTTRAAWKESRHPRRSQLPSAGVRD